jgi:hypothetical protein
LSSRRTRPIIQQQRPVQIIQQRPIVQIRQQPEYVFERPRPQVIQQRPIQFVQQPLVMLVQKLIINGKFKFKFKFQHNLKFDFIKKIFSIKMFHAKKPENFGAFDFT